MEWALVAHWWGVGWDEWQTVSTEDQAFMIATYRCAMQIDAVLAWHPTKRPQGRGR